ncbi:hypothetical protein [Pseudoxanthomonas sp. 10H]|uniref:hypothetical protein n=1 Tax=Pseudoxanthomonas sp. 10H TaxID=3242729 RepID=UPI003557E066
MRIPDTAPGTFFAIGMGALLLAAGVAAWAVAAPPVPTWALVLGVTAAGAAAYSAAATWTATIDARSMARDGTAEGGRRCEACGHVSPLRPWSR